MQMCIRPSGASDIYGHASEGLSQSSVKSLQPKMHHSLQASSPRPSSRPSARPSSPAKQERSYGGSGSGSGPNDNLLEAAMAARASSPSGRSRTSSPQRPTSRVSSETCSKVQQQTLPVSFCFEKIYAVRAGLVCDAIVWGCRCRFSSLNLRMGFQGVPANLHRIDLADCIRPSTVMV